MLADVVFPLSEEGRNLVEHQLWELRSEKGISLFASKPQSAEIVKKPVAIVSVPEPVAAAHFQEKMDVKGEDRLIFQCKLYVSGDKVVIEVDDEPLDHNAVENIEKDIKMFL